MNSFLLELPGSLDTFPRTRNLDKDALLINSSLLVHCDEFVGCHIAVRLSTRVQNERQRELIPLEIVASVSKERRASTSVETTPGTIPRISTPKLTASRSSVFWRSFPNFFPYEIASFTSSSYSGSWAAASSNDGFVVASVGL